jgi:hypothetical protein
MRPLIDAPAGSPNPYGSGFMLVAKDHSPLQERRHDHPSQAQPGSLWHRPELVRPLGLPRHPRQYGLPTSGGPSLIRVGRKLADSLSARLDSVTHPSAATWRAYDVGSSGHLDAH